jgi:hypothetical protein
MLPAAAACLAAVLATSGASGDGQERALAPAEGILAEERVQRGVARSLGLPPPIISFEVELDPLADLEPRAPDWLAIQPSFLPPIWESWTAVDFTPAGGGAYYGQPFHLRGRARFAIAVQARP